ncbi:Ankyrin repeat and SAM domain-containing protein 3 [Colletotrichum sp. SAR 10_86]|nr:Ankyrin repeat and SAM domain-containing protein 3 [Colletotrichum sp. SAR 10_86]
MDSCEPLSTNWGMPSVLMSRWTTRFDHTIAIVTDHGLSSSGIKSHQRLVAGDEEAEGDKENVQLRRLAVAVALKGLTHAAVEGPLELVQGVRPKIVREWLDANTTPRWVAAMSFSSP